MKKQFLIIILILFSFNSCKIVTSLRELKKENVDVFSYSINNKEVKFVPMHHIGKKEFYDDLKSKISQFKSKGYRVYYELISTDLKIDTLQKDIIRRKVRKIKGFSGTYEAAVSGTNFEKYVKQPTYKELGITETDLRADVDYIQFINEWEKINGEIVLDSIDIETDFGEKYEKGNFYSNNQYKKIVIDYRNQYLLDMINSNNDDKILVIYGAGHRKDFEKKSKTNR